MIPTPAILAIIFLFVGCFLIAPYGTMSSAAAAKKLDYNALIRRFSFFARTRLFIVLVGVPVVAVFYFRAMAFPCWLATVATLSVLWVRDFWVIENDAKKLFQGR